MRGVTKVAPGTGNLDWMEWDVPVPTETEVVIEVAAAGICGTDISVYKWSAELAAQYQWPTPLLLGHEFSGRVYSVGSKMTGLDLGELVTANPIHSCGTCYYCQNGQSEICDNRPMLGLHLPGAFTRFVKVRASNVYRVPFGVNSHVAALCEPLAVAVHALKRTEFQPGQSVAVVGAGPIGLLLALVARRLGAEQVFVTGIDRDQARLAVAAQLGATPINIQVDDVEWRVKSGTCGRGADLVFEAAGNSSAVQQALSLVRRGGKVGLVSLPHCTTEIPTSTVALREYELIGSRAYNETSFARAVEMLSELQDALPGIISHTVSMQEGIQAFDMAVRGEGCKILLTTG